MLKTKQIRHLYARALDEERKKLKALRILTKLGSSRSSRSLRDIEWDIGSCLGQIRLLKECCKLALATETRRDEF